MRRQAFHVVRLIVVPLGAPLAGVCALRSRTPRRLRHLPPPRLLSGRAPARIAGPLAAWCRRLVCRHTSHLQPHPLAAHGQHAWAPAHPQAQQRPPLSNAPAASCPTGAHRQPRRVHEATRNLGRTSRRAAGPRGLERPRHTHGSLRGRAAPPTLLNAPYPSRRGACGARAWAWGALLPCPPERGGGGRPAADCHQRSRQCPPPQLPLARSRRQNAMQAPRAPTHTHMREPLMR